MFHVSILPPSYLVGDGPRAQMETSGDCDHLTWIFLVTVLQLHLTSLLDQPPLPGQLRQCLLGLVSTASCTTRAGATTMTATGAAPVQKTLYTSSYTSQTQISIVTVAITGNKSIP